MVLQKVTAKQWPKYFYFSDNRIRQFNPSTGLVSEFLQKEKVLAVGDLVLEDSGNLLAANPSKCNIVEILNDGWLFCTLIAKQVREVSLILI